MRKFIQNPLLVCLTVALLLRLAFIFAGFPYFDERWHLREDGDGYGEIAQTIREGRYDDVTRGPVYPVLVAMAGKPVVVKVVQAILDTLTCLLIYFLAGRRVWPAWLWAVYPFAIWRVAFINKEIVVALLVAGYVWVQLRAMREKHVGWWLAAGVVLGVLNLAKPVFLVWPVVLLAFAPRRALWTVLAMLVVIAPWTYRNWRVTGGELLPVATERGGVTTFVGNYQATAGAWEGAGKVKWSAAVEGIKLQHAGESVVALDRTVYRAAWREVAGHMWKAGEMVVRKCWRFWFVSAAQRERVVSFVIQMLYLIAAGIGLWRARLWSREVWLMVAVAGYVMVLHALSYADLRMSLPVMPLVCALVATKTRG